MADENIIGAFSEEHAERLTGISRHQLRRWDRMSFLTPSYGWKDRRSPYSRIYSFRDIVSLKVLNDLRNKKGVSLQHLRQVSKRLAHLGDSKWTATTLYVLGKRVVFEHPGTSEREEVVSGQRVLNIPLRIVISSTRQAIKDLNQRGPREVGKIVQGRFVMQNEPVFAGTRILVAGVKRYIAAGYASAKVIREYPELTIADLEAARVYQDRRIAA
jgi:uncharacterized protein (DUF433 family)/DNA-binding transcriptional MerR regulator